jgi:hypothetical protein
MYYKDIGQYSFCSSKNRREPGALLNNFPKGGFDFISGGNQYEAIEIINNSTTILLTGAFFCNGRTIYRVDTK